MINNLTLGLVFVLVGLLFLFGGRFVASLPVIHYQTKHCTFYFPIGLCLLLSVLFTLATIFIKE